MGCGYMVWIEVASVGRPQWKAHSVDGYLPTRERMEGIYQQLFPEIPQYVVANHTREELFLLAVERQQPHYLKSRQLKCSWCELFMLGFEEEKPVFPPFTYLYNEFLHEPNQKDYRFLLVFPNPDGADGHCGECIDNATQELMFRNKQKSGYADYNKFRGKVEEMVGGLTERYLFPAKFVEEEFKRFCFGCYRS